MSSYVQELEAKLAASRTRLAASREIIALKASAPTLFEIIDTEISLELNRGYGDTPLGYEEYLASHGAVRGIRRIRNLLDSKAAEEVVANQEVVSITEQLEQFSNDQEQQ